MALSGTSRPISPVGSSKVDQGQLPAEAHHLHLKFTSDYGDDVSAMSATGPLPVPRGVPPQTAAYTRTRDTLADLRRLGAVIPTLRPGPPLPTSHLETAAANFVALQVRISHPLEIGAGVNGA
jgi:hypothetical protein